METKQRDESRRSTGLMIERTIHRIERAAENLKEAIRRAEDARREIRKI